jgi:hypothetical protein
VTVDDVVATYGERKPATKQEAKGTRGLFISVVDKVVDAESEKSGTSSSIEWMHIMSKLTSDKKPWLNLWKKNTSFMGMSDNKLNVNFD